MKGKGVAPVSIPKINKLCDAYTHERDKRCEMTPKEIAAKGKLIDAIHEAVKSGQIQPDKNGEVVYRYGDTVISLKPGKEKLNVKEVGTGNEPE
jgi:hypothetical protein